MAGLHAHDDVMRSGGSPQSPRGNESEERAGPERRPAGSQANQIATGPAGMRPPVPALGAPEPLSLQRVPPLRNPILLMAFEGWNDAGEAASTAARLVVSQRDGGKFASIDPEEFFVFTDTRPHVRLSRRGRRRIEWPANEFFACPDPGPDPDARDLVVLLGTEPDLRWRAFSHLVMDVARRAGVQLVVALGALNAEVPHTVPPHVSASAANQDLHPLLDGVAFRPSKYQGPTGIVGVLTGRFAEAGYPVVNLWGHAPHYISASPNPVVAARLVRRLASMLHLTLDLEMLDEAAHRFDEQVREAVAKDPEAMAYVRDLENLVRQERAADGEDDEAIHSPSGELPSGAAMVDYLEEFLRNRRRPPNPGRST
jgi:proteasome assembly chaperone (PAC2) family protein